METLNENIVPKELVVGISGNLCYVTYYEKKGKKILMNSERSWTDWSNNSSNPLIIENKFSSGFKLAGTNGRWSRNAANAENLLIEHPLFNKSFEISISRFIEIAKQCTITNGVIDLEMIMTKGRDIISKSEYNKLNKEDINRVALETQLKEKNSANSVKSKDQIPGTVYINRKNNQRTIYLGEVNDSSWAKPKFAYIEAGWREDEEFNKSFKESEGHNGWGKDKISFKKSAPSILKLSYWDNKWSYDLPYNISIVASKKPMTYTDGNSADNPLDSIYINYTEEDWKLIYSIYNKFNSWDKTYFHGTPNKPVIIWDK